MLINITNIMIILTIMTNIIPNIDINLEYVQNQIGIITTDLDSMIQVDTIFLEVSSSVKVMDSMFQSYI